MKLLNQIIEEAVNDDVRLVTILRRCLILAEELDNDGLRTWVENELNGYPSVDQLPAYRVASVTAKGTFLGGFGAQLNNQPLPASVLEKEHRWWAKNAHLNEPITSYERIASDPDKNGFATINWPPDLTVYYQSKFIQGYALNRAWQEVPMGALAGVVDTVRTRLLQFALELRRDVGRGEEIEVEIQPAVVEQAVQTIIYGGTNIVGSTVEGNVQLIGQQLVVEGDLISLNDKLTEVGISKERISELEQAISADKADGAEKGFGARVAAWLGKAGSFAGKESGKAASVAAGKAVTVAVLAYFGING